MLGIGEQCRKSSGVPLGRSTPSCGPRQNSRRPCSLLPQQAIHHPAAARVLATRPAMRQNIGVVAAGLLQRVGEDGQAAEGTVLVDAPGGAVDGRGAPGRVEGDGAEEVAEEAAEKGGLLLLLGYE